MAFKKVTVLGTSLDYANNHLLARLCKFKDIHIIWFDLSLRSTHGSLGAKLVMQAGMCHPSIRIDHTDDIGIATNADVFIIWGINFSHDSLSAYKEFFTGKFKQSVELHAVQEENFSPEILFMRSHRSGIRAANILGNEIPSLKHSIYVLTGVAAQQVYPLSDGRYKVLELPPTHKLHQMIQELEFVDGGMVDIGAIVLLLENCVFDPNSSPRDTFSFVGVYPDQSDIDDFGLKGKVCLFMPKKNQPSYPDELKECLKKEENAMIDFMK